MEVITLSNIERATFLNIKEALDSNTLSVKISSSFSKNTVVPIVVLEVSKIPLSKNIHNVPNYAVDVEISCVSGTKKESDEIGEEVESIMSTYESTFEGNNLSYFEHKSLNNNFTRGDSRLHVRKFLYRFLVTRP